MTPGVCGLCGELAGHDAGEILFLLSGAGGAAANGDTAQDLLRRRRAVEVLDETGLPFDA